jgi:hypothetical protein
MKKYLAPLLFSLTISNTPALTLTVHGSVVEIEKGGWSWRDSMSIGTGLPLFLGSLSSLFSGSYALRVRQPPIFFKRGVGMFLLGLAGTSTGVTTNNRNLKKEVRLCNTFKKLMNADLDQSVYALESGCDNSEDVQAKNACIFQKLHSDKNNALPVRRIYTEPSEMTLDGNEVFYELINSNDYYYLKGAASSEAITLKKSTTYVVEGNSLSTFISVDPYNNITKCELLYSM